MRAVLFDLYGVIMHEQNDDFLKKIEQAAGQSGTEFWDAYWAVRHPFDAGTISASQYWDLVADKLGKPIADPEKATQIDVESWLEEDPAMVQYITDLHDAGIPIGLLSNITLELSQVMLEEKPWLKYFNPRIFSCNTGLAKPQAEIYELALREFGLPASEVLFVDDRAVNVTRAREVGLPAHMFVTKEELIPVVEEHLANH